MPTCKKSNFILIFLASPPDSAFFLKLLTTWLSGHVCTGKVWKLLGRCRGLNWVKLTSKISRTPRATFFSAYYYLRFFPKQSIPDALKTRAEVFAIPLPSPLVLTSVLAPRPPLCLSWCLVPWEPFLTAHSLFTWRFGEAAKHCPLGWTSHFSWLVCILNYPVKMGLREIHLHPCWESCWGLLVSQEQMRPPRMRDFGNGWGMMAIRGGNSFTKKEEDSIY